MNDVAQGSTRAGGVLAATCISTLVVNANTSAVTILLPAISQDVDAPAAGRLSSSGNAPGWA